MLIGSLALLTGYTSFHEIFAAFHLGSPISYALAVLAAFVIGMLMMIENSRMPFDDPKTHLELTMVHEVMILDYSGFDLGLILSAGMLKFAVYGAMIVNLFIGIFPYQYAIPMFFAIQAGAAIITGGIESFMARFRMSHNVQFIFALTSVSLLIFFGALLILGSSLKLKILAWCNDKHRPDNTPYFPLLCGNCQPAAHIHQSTGFPGDPVVCGGFHSVE